jgi:cell division protein FtsB
LGRARPNRSAVPRPATRRAEPATPPVSLQKEPPRRLAVTTRAALLALTVCLVALTMAYPLRAYFTQRASIADARNQQKQDQQAVADLRRTVAQYENRASVQDEARRRLHFQLPGETVYYLPAPPPPAKADPSRVHTPAVADKRDRAWYDQLWGSAVETSK